MLAQILQKRKACYEILERTEKGALDSTPPGWNRCLDRAFDATKTTLDRVLRKARF
jgi:hypothetical protein